jgi:hypothetical protein
LTKEVKLRPKWVKKGEKNGARKRHKIPLCMVVDYDCVGRLARTRLLSSHGHIRLRRHNEKMTRTPHLMYTWKMSHI